MPDSMRKTVTEGLVTTIKLIDGAGVYLTDATGTDQVSKRQSVLERSRGHPYVVFVHSGEEVYEVDELSPVRMRAVLESLIDVQFDGSSADDAEDRSADVLHDIHLAVGLNPELGGSTTECRLSSVDALAVDDTGSKIIMRVRTRTSYFYTVGTEI